MSDLVAFLLERISEDEAAARDADARISPSTWRETTGAVRSNWHVVHIARWDPARVLAECAAKRRIVETARDYSPELEHGDNGEWAFDVTLRLLALPYADHSDYRDEWRP